MIMESIVSITPPRPRITAPESLTCADRFKINSTRSPAIAASAVQSPVSSEPLKLFPNDEGNTKYARAPTAMGANTPPIKPAMLLFGLAGT